MHTAHDSDATFRLHARAPRESDDDSPAPLTHRDPRPHAVDRSAAAAPPTAAFFQAKDQTPAATRNNQTRPRASRRAAARPWTFANRPARAECLRQTGP